MYQAPGTSIVVCKAVAVYTWTVCKFVESFPTSWLIFHLVEGLLSLGVGESCEFYECNDVDVTIRAYDMAMEGAAARVGMALLYPTILHSHPHARYVWHA